MRRFILTLLLASTAALPSVAGPVSPSSCPGCILNTADPQNAQINIGTATIRGTLTVSTLSITNLAITNLTATNLSGAGAGITNLNASSLASGTVPSARVAGSYTGITGVGTIAAGTWNGSIVGTQYGGSGKNWVTVSTGAIPYFDAVGSMTTLAAGASNRVLQANGSAAPSWTAAPTVLGTNITAIPLASLSSGNLPQTIAVSDASLSTVSAVKVIGNISGNAGNITGTLALSQLGAGQLAANIVAQKLTATGVSSGTYGGPSVFSQVTVSTDGRVTSAAQGPIAISVSQISTGTLPSGFRVPASNIDPGTLGASVIASSIAANTVNTPQIANAAVTSSKLNATGVAAGTYGGLGNTVQIVVSTDGRVSSLAQFGIPGVSTTSAQANVDNAWNGPGQTSFSSWTFVNASGIRVYGPVIASSFTGDGSFITGIQPTNIAAGFLPSNVIATAISNTIFSSMTFTDDVLVQGILEAADTLTVRDGTAALRVVGYTADGFDPGMLIVSYDEVLFTVQPLAVAGSTVIVSAGAEAEKNWTVFYSTGVTSTRPITAPSFLGNATTASAFDHNPSDCSAGDFATGIAANGDLFCNADGSQLEGVSIAQNILTVAPVGAQYTTVGAAIAALGVPTSTTTIWVADGIYIETPFTIPSNGAPITVRGLVGQPTLLCNTSGVPCVTVSTGSAAINFKGITIQQNTFNAPAVKVDGQLVGNTITPGNPVGFSDLAAPVGNPGVLVTGTRPTFFANANVIGIVNPALVTVTTAHVAGISSQFLQLVNNFDAVRLGGSPDNTRFLNSYFYATGTGKGLNATVPVTPILGSLTFLNGENGLGSNISASTSAMTVNSGLMVTGSTFAYGNPPATFNGTAYSESFLPPSNYLVVTTSGVVVRQTTAGFTRFTGQQQSIFGYANAGGSVGGICVGGTESAPTACASGSNMTFISAKGYDGSTNTNGQGSTGGITISAAETFTPTARGTNLDLETALAGTTTRRKRLRIGNDGRMVLAPRANTVSGLGWLHVKANDAGIGVAGNLVGGYFEEAIVSLSTVEATGFFGGGSGLTNLNAGNITAGTLAVANGGTGNTNRTLTDGSSVVSVDWGNRTLKNGANTQVMDWGGGGGGGNLADDSGIVSVKWNDRYLRNAAGNLILDWSGSGVTTPSSFTATTYYGDGSNLTGIVMSTTSPGGSDTQVQFNDAGNFNGDSLFLWNSVINRLTLGDDSGLSSLYAYGNSEVASWRGVSPYTTFFRTGTSQNSYVGTAGSLVTGADANDIVVRGGDDGSEHSILFAIGTFEKMRVNATNGYVGILNTSPAAPLHVTGEVRASTFNAVGSAFQLNSVSFITSDFNLSVASGSFTGPVIAQSSVTAAYFVGDGSALTGISAGACATGSGTSSVLCQGSGNVAAGNFSAVSGGATNVVSAGATYSVISAGQGNTITAGLRSFIGGGDGNTSSTQFSVIGGGEANTISGTANGGTIAGGELNTVSGSRAFVGGGELNTASGGDATVAGGDSNTASGNYSSIPGGLGNTASGSFSIAIGRQAKATAEGSFVAADNQAVDLIGSTTNQFLIRYNGGASFVVGSSTFTGTVSVNSGTNIVYHCTGSTAGTFDGNLARGNGNAGACAGGTWVATSLKVD